MVYFQSTLMDFDAADFHLRLAELHYGLLMKILHFDTGQTKSYNNLARSDE